MAITGLLRLIAQILQQQRYAAAEAYARAERTGLWARHEPLAPWLFRKQQHTAQPQ